MLQYIHFNRHQNSLLINDLKKQIEAHHPPPPPPVPGQVLVLVRKEVSNPADYFDKTFAEYEEGFESKGTVLKKQWHGLKI